MRIRYGPSSPSSSSMASVELALDYLSDVEVTAYLHQRFGHAGLAADLAPVCCISAPRGTPCS